MPLNEIGNFYLCARGQKQAALPKPKKRFRVRPHSLGLKPGIDATRFNQLLDQLDVEAFVAKRRGSRKKRR
jgi:hypothetical protein